MVEVVGFDFEMLSFVSVEAPDGTDPETLVEKALDLFVERIRNGDYEINCFQTISLETGEVTPESSLERLSGRCKIYSYENFGDTIAFAESLGWIDPDLDRDGEWTAEKSDATEQSALAFIGGRGFVIDMNGRNFSG